ncbi:hypothetical protein F4823DRAFT_565258 [Ustulina deusta]|nr:hypothetical protein F4823DRAFT_565258 [Ustulina deusta]
MTSPLVRRIVTTVRELSSYDLPRELSTLQILRNERSLSSIAVQSQRSRHRTSTPLQTARMSSTNLVNKNLTRDRLFDCKRHVVLALVANDAKVYMTSRTSEKLARVAETYLEGPDTITPVQSDITSQAGIGELVGAIASQEPRGLHILVNSADVVDVTRLLAAEMVAGNRVPVRVNAAAPGESQGDQKSELAAEKYAEKDSAARPGRDGDMA